VKAAERAVVEPSVEPIANTNRIVPAVVGEARDKRKRVTFAGAVAAHVEPVAVVATQLGVDVGLLTVQAQRTRRRNAPQRIDSASTASTAHAAQSDRRQQHADHTSLAKLCFTVSCLESV
jgi:hypothetical protein